VSKDKKEAIFDKNGKQVSDWFDYIERYYDLVTGKSDYYIAKENGKEAIFHKDGRQISDWFDWFRIYGLTRGESNYYIAVKDGKEAIFNEDGHQISDWYDHICRYGLVRGKSDYYIVFVQDAKKKGTKKETIYLCKLGSSKVLGPFKEIKRVGFIDSPSKDIIKLKTLEGRYKTFTKQELDAFFEEKEMEDEKTR
jgi:hypothetical protein